MQPGSAEKSDKLQKVKQRLLPYSMNRIHIKTVILLLVLVLQGLVMAGCSAEKDWRTANRESAGMAPDPASTQEAILLVYGAKAWSWRGWFAIHTWIAAKHTGETSYTVYDVIGWRSHHNQPVLKIYHDVPDRYWYGEKPRVIREYRGKEVDRLIDSVDKAANAYPWKTVYKAFPGPNSNTFTGWIARQVPELELKLPFSAIGSGYADQGTGLR
jgi:hypothetical protein